MASVLTEEMQMIAEDRDYVDGVENSKKPFFFFSFFFQAR